MFGNLPRASIARWLRDYNVYHFCFIGYNINLPLYVGVRQRKCRTRDNTSPYSAFWREKFHMTTGILKMKEDSKPRRETKTFFSTRAVVFFLAQTLA